MNFNWQNPYSNVRSPVFARNVVSTSHPLAAQAGLRMMQRGGNAVDAALAAAAMLTVVEPVMCGIGGDAFAILWDGSELRGLNASGVAPAAWNRGYFKAKYGEESSGVAKRPMRGWDSATVPGVVAGWAALHQRFGKLPFADLFEPAIEAAIRGFWIAPIVAEKWAVLINDVGDQPGFAETYMPHGRAPRLGELFKAPMHGDTLRRIAESGGRDFYEGELAHRIERASVAAGAAMRASDLRDYNVEWVTPISKSYRGFTVHEIPPNGQGIAALMALGILENFDMGELKPDSADSIHLQLEAMKLAFADVYRNVADSGHMHVKPEEMLDSSYLATRSASIDLKKASSFSHGLPKSEGTIYLTAADESGMMISFIQSNYMGFGSGVVVPQTGIALQNRGVGFSMDPASANVVEGGKRPFHTIIPGFLSTADGPLMSFGVMGGDMQPQGHVQTLTRMIDHRQQPQTACDAPRWKVNRNQSVVCETTVDPSTIADLRSRGHSITAIEDPTRHEFGAGQFIMRIAPGAGEGYVAASDFRRDGQAVGF